MYHVNHKKNPNFLNISLRLSEVKMANTGAVIENYGKIVFKWATRPPTKKMFAHKSCHIHAHSHSLRKSRRVWQKLLNII